MILNHSAAEVVRQAIEDLALVTDVSDSGSWPSYIDSMPDTPDNVVCFYDRETIIRGRNAITGDMLETPGIQVIIRGTTRNVARTKAQAILEAFDRTILRTQVIVGSFSYKLDEVTRTGIILPTREPDTRRWFYSLNALVTLYQSSGTGA